MRLISVSRALPVEGHPFLSRLVAMARTRRSFLDAVLTGKMREMKRLSAAKAGILIRVLRRYARDSWRADGREMGFLVLIFFEKFKGRKPSLFTVSDPTSESYFYRCLLEFVAVFT